MMVQIAITFGPLKILRILIIDAVLLSLKCAGQYILTRAFQGKKDSIDDKYTQDFQRPKSDRNLHHHINRPFYHRCIRPLDCAAVLLSLKCAGQYTFE